MPHGRGAGAVRRARAASATAPSPGCGAASIGDAGAYGGFGGMLAIGLDADDGAGRLPHPEDRLRRRGRAHEPHADGRVPRRGTPGGGGVARAHPRHGRRRARHGPGRAAAQEPHPARRVPVLDRHRRHLRQSATTTPRSPRRCASPTTTALLRRAGGAPRARRRQAARHRHAALRRDHRRRGRRVLRGRDARRRQRDAEGGHVGARPGSRHRVLADRVRPSSASRSRRSASCSPTPRSSPRGGGTGGSRSLQLGGSAVLETCAAAWLDRAEGPRRRAARGVARRHRARQRRPPRRRRRAGEGAHVGRARDQARPTTASRCWSQHDFRAVGLDVPVRRARRRWSRSTPRPAGSCRSATSRSTTAARILNPMLVDGQVHGGLASGISQALWEEFVYDDDGNPLTSTLAEYAHPERGRVPVVRGRAHRDAVAAQPARREGHRRVGHGGLARPRCRTRSSTRSATSACATSTCPCTPERVWRTIEDATRGHPARPVARAAGGVRHPRRPPAGRAEQRTRRSTSEPRTRFARLGEGASLDESTGTICEPMKIAVCVKHVPSRHPRACARLGHARPQRAR